MQLTERAELESTRGFDFGTVLRAFREGLPIIALSCLVFVLAGVAYLAVAHSSYTGSASILIDPYRSQSALVDAPLADSPIDSSIVDTQVELIKSENVARLAVKQLGADAERLLVGAAKPSRLPAWLQAPLDRAKALLARGSDDTARDETQELILALQSNLAVKRTGITFVLLVSFRGSTPDGAAQVANTVAQAYLADQVNVRVAAAQRLSAILNQRAEELRQGAIEAARKTQTYQGGDQIISTQLRTAADIARSSYERFKARALEAEQAGANSLSDARLVSPAWPPPRRSWPRSSVVLLVSVILGLMMGLGLALARQVMTRVYRNEGDVRDDFSPFIGRFKLPFGLARSRAAISWTNLGAAFVDPRSSACEIVRRTSSFIDPTIRNGCRTAGVVALGCVNYADVLATGLALSYAESGLSVTLVPSQVTADTRSDVLPPAASDSREIVSHHRVPAPTTGRDYTGDLEIASLGLDLAGVTAPQIRAALAGSAFERDLRIVSINGRDFGAAAAWLVNVDVFVILLGRGRARRRDAFAMLQIPDVMRKCTGVVLCR